MKSNDSGTGRLFPAPGKRIAIIGATGSGKTTLARQLSRVLGIYHIELDSIMWLPDWQKEDWDVTRQQVQQKMDTSGWVCDGNYSKLRDIIWQQADTIIWLDYPFLLVFFRLFFRTMKRVFLRTRLWNNNRESFQKTFFIEGFIISMVVPILPQAEKDLSANSGETRIQSPEGYSFHPPFSDEKLAAKSFKTDNQQP